MGAPETIVADAAPAGPACTDAVEATAAAGCASCGSTASGEEMYRRVGQLTRSLHDALRQLGYDKDLQQVRDGLPDARDRLSYIARVTGEAAEKVLNAVDRANELQDDLAQRALRLQRRWDAVGAFADGEAGRATPAGRELIEETGALLTAVGEQTAGTKAILTDIMMAQDFHDLTGQVIRKVVVLAQTMEEQLIRMLIEATPPEQRSRAELHLEGPIVNAEQREDVVAGQEAVDDLLASLGF